MMKRKVAVWLVAMIVLLSVAACSDEHVINVPASQCCDEGHVCEPDTVKIVCVKKWRHGQWHMECDTTHVQR